MDLLVQFGFFALLLAIGLFFGGRNERAHYSRIEADEAAVRDVLVFNERHLPADMDIERGCLVVGSVVVGEDYFKRVASALKSLFGGRLTVYESLMDRGRRHAIVRMKQEARRQGATMVFNVRFETSSLSEDSGERSSFSAEFLAYGTAIVPRS